MNIIERVQREISNNGVKGFALKAWRKTGRLLWYTTCSVWYERDLDEPIDGAAPGLEVDVEFLVQDRGKLVQWLREKKSAYPWIYFDKEIEAAQAHSHIFLTLLHQGDIVGYIKIGRGRTYIHDFDQAPVFPPGTAFIYDTFVLPEYRKKGLAAFALEHASRYFRQNHYKKILCHIEEWNVDSIRAFEGAGYRAVGKIRFIRTAGMSFFLKKGFVPFLSLEHHLSRAAGPVMARRSLISALALLALSVLLPTRFAYSRKASPKTLSAAEKEAASPSPRPLPEVLQVHCPGACSWDYGKGDYTQAVDYAAVKRMLESGLMAFTGASGAALAWKKIIQPYSRGDRILIKPNLNNTIIGYSQAIMTSPQVVRAIVESLLDAGYPADDITIYDLTAYRDQDTTRRFAEMGVSTAFISVRPGILERVAARLHAGVDAPDTNALVHMQKPVRDAQGNSVRCYMPKVLTQARHLINVPVFKAHQFVLQSNALKNHFGTVRFSNLNTHPVVLHGEHINWHIADVNANEHIRNKTRLIVVDALLGAGCFRRGSHDRVPGRWRTLSSDNTPSSLFFAQDPLAVESVLADFIIDEQRAGGYEPYSHEYLHIAEKLGLGCHEHRDEDGSYSRIRFTRVSI